VPSCAQLTAAVGAVVPGQQLEDCAGVLLPTGAQVASCADLTAAIASVVPGQQLEDCAGNLHATGAQVPSCTEMNAAIATAVGAITPGQNLQNCAGVLHANGAQVPSCTEMNAAIAAAVGAITPSQQLENCAGVLHANGAQVPSCTEMNAAIAAAVGAVVPGQNLQDCNGVTLPNGTDVVTCAEGEARYLRKDGTNGPVTGPIDFNDNLLTDPVIDGYAETGVVANVSGAVNYDLAVSNNYQHTLNGNITAAFLNPPPAGRFGNLTIALVQDGVGGRTVTWPASVRWAGGAAPTQTLTANARDVFTFFTTNGGTYWYGFAAGLNFGP
jgi:hypothetical protein